MRIFWKCNKSTKIKTKFKFLNIFFFNQNTFWFIVQKLYLTHVHLNCFWKPSSDRWFGITLSHTFLPSWPITRWISCFSSTFIHVNWRYYISAQNKVTEYDIKKLLEANIDSMRFQHDGATCLRSPNHIIFFCNGVYEWPPRFCDIISCDFFLFEVISLRE